MLRCPTYTMLFVLAAIPALANAETLTFQDPKGDDNGSGKMTYPTGKDYSAGAFDLTKLEIREDGDDVIFEAEFAATISDPWNSKEWNGNGFSLQFVQVYLDTDGKKRSGEFKGVPGSWVEFSADNYYEKVVLISPQGSAKLAGELDAKARWLKSRVVIPSRTESRGKTLVARVPAKDLGGKPSAKWAVQALVLSNEGFPAPEDVLSRRTNEMNGEHRFGGGCDGLGDPQVMDMLAGSGAGTDAEAKTQHAQLAAYKCADAAKDAKVAKIGMAHK